MRALLAVALLLPACVQILGGEREVIGDDRACSDDDDCRGDDGCDDGVCRLRCFEDAECGAFRTCSSRFCSDPVGTPCDPGDYLACGGSSCETAEADKDETLGYCTVSCYSSQGSLCPTGYTCIDYKCLLVDD